jgi:hypothetical protein
MSKYYILTGIGREKFHNTSDYIEWINELSKTDIDFTVTDLGVAVDIRGFLELIRPSFKLSPEPGHFHRFGVVSVDGSYVPLSVKITVVNNLGVSDRWSTEGFIEISDLHSCAEFYWVPDSGALKLKQISGDEPGGPSPVFLDNLATIGGLKSYLYGTV